LGAFCNLTEVKEALIARYGLVPARVPKGNGPARYWKVPGARGMVGFITPISDKYCDSCNRMRLTANGELRPCLAYDVHVKAGGAIRRGDRRAVRQAFLRAAEIKPQGHRWEVGQTTQTVMSSLGG
jgi:cyclic pyranopterin phosphate synthase